MTSAKRYLPILLLGVVMLCSVAVCDDEGISTYAGNIGIENPCNNALVNVTGTNYALAHDNTRDRDHDGVHVALRFIGYGNDPNGNLYRTVLTATDRFGTEEPYYDLLFHSMWVGRNHAPSFSMDGVVRVFVHFAAKDPKVLGSNIMQFHTTCRNDVESDDDKDSDADHNRHSH